MKKDVREEIILGLKSAISDLALPGAIRHLALQGETLQPAAIVLETPKDERYGDYSTNIAMKMFSKNPFELAQKIADQFKVRNSKPLIFSRVEAVKPGFINFFLSEKYLIGQLSLMLNKAPLRQVFAGHRIMVEFTDPNPFKELHIGHLYSNAVGEAISRLFEANGALVKRANYQGDVGMHVAKALWGISNIKDKISNIEKRSPQERIKFLGQAYTLGSKVYEEDKDAKKAMQDINKKIYEKDPSVISLYEKGKRWSLDYFERIYKRLGTKFDFYYFESEVGGEGLKLVKEYLKKGIFVESHGAVIFKGEKYGLHNRVFVNSLGLPTYEAKELGLAFRKYRDFEYDQSVIVTGNEVIEYFKVLLTALKQISLDLAKKTVHIAHGMVRLEGGKMSSRAGNVMTGEWLLDEAKSRIRKTYPEMDQEAAEKVAVGAVKYALLKSGIGKDIVFDFDESISLEGNSGPYLQYTFARTQSVLRKLKARNSKLALQGETLQPQALQPEEVLLLRWMYRFPDMAEDAVRNFAPNVLCNYLFSLAQKFNLFYQKHSILQSKIEEQRVFRIALTRGIGQIIKNGLDILGIQAPERM